jgi:nucleotide-binding universal stress UspA family protein
MAITGKTKSTPPVLAAVDLGPSTARVLRHAAGFARLWSAPLRVVYVSTEDPAKARKRVIDVCAAQGPYEVDLSDEDVIVRSGIVSEAIYREAVKQRARMIVMGSRARNMISKWLLGSTSAAVLRNAPVPVLLVPPVDRDIIDIADTATLHCGRVLAAIDPRDHCVEQLQMAGEMARLARQPLVMMTVSSRALTDHVAAAILRQRAHESTTVKPRAIIVRHGDIAEEISRCAVTEDCGLVVMGLRARGYRQAGAIASAVLKTNRAFVLAVPPA